MTKKGSFVTFEGNEGVGKSTQIRLISEYCLNNNIPHIKTREPGGTMVAEKIREILLGIEIHEEIDPKTEALLYAAARAQHFENVILPRVNSGKMVLCDRFLDSSIAYQAYGRGLKARDVYALSMFAIKNQLPNLTLCLLLDPKLAFERKGGMDLTDRMETSGLDFHYRVYEGFQELAVKNPDRIVVIDASKSVEEVYNNIIKTMKERLPEFQREERE